MSRLASAGLIVLLFGLAPKTPAVLAQVSGTPADLPDAPDAVAASGPPAAEVRTPTEAQSPVALPAKAGAQASAVASTPCAVKPSGETYLRPQRIATEAEAAHAVRPPALVEQAACPHENVYHRFLDDAAPAPLTPRQKATLAMRNIADPFNLLTIVGNSAIFIGANSHTAYGPAWEGFGYNVGVSLLQDATGETVGTFMLCSLFHQDPHYHRMPHANPPRRVMHAILHTVVAPSDTGSTIPNMENFLGYPINAEIANLYVPGLQTNLPATAARVLTGLATDPIGNLITEFLPDVAKHLHVKVVFVQRIINQVATGTESPQQ